MEDNEIKQAFPALPLTDEVRQLARREAGTLSVVRRRKARVRGTVLGAIVTFALVSGGAILGPPAYANYRIQRIVGSVEDCQTAVYRRYTIKPDGTKQPAGTILYSQGKWRVEMRPNGVDIFAKGVLWAYDKDINQVVKSYRPNGPYAYTPSGFSIKSIVADHARWKWPGALSVGSEMLDGKEMETVSIASNGRLKTKIFADPQTHMPVCSIDLEKTAEGWKERGFSTFEFNTSLSEGLFAPEFPKDARVVDTGKIRDAWAKKLEKPIAVLKSKSSTIQIRDFAVNERGHIFIVFSDGETESQRREYAFNVRRGMKITSWHVAPTWKVEDSLGNVYWQTMGGLQPYVGGINDKVSPWIVLADGQLPQGAWLIPKDEKKWSPRKITLSCTINKGGEENFNWPGETTTSWTLDLSKPTTRLIPTWAPACAFAPREEKDLLSQEKLLRDTNGMPNFIPARPKE